MRMRRSLRQRADAPLITRLVDWKRREESAYVTSWHLSRNAAWDGGRHRKDRSSDHISEGADRGAVFVCAKRSVREKPDSRVLHIV